jgi:hypothetical protein
MLIGAGGDEITAAGLAATPTTASGHDQFEVAARLRISAANVGRIDADDEFPAPIARKLQFELASILCLRGRASLFLGHLAVKPLASSDGAFADGRMGGYAGKWVMTM